MRPVHVFHHGLTYHHMRLYMYNIYIHIYYVLISPPIPLFIILQCKLHRKYITTFLYVPRED
jgi:hypothetical protein